MLCENTQEKRQGFYVSSALLHLTHSILPQFCAISHKRVKEGYVKCRNLY